MSNIDLQTTARRSLRGTYVIIAVLILALSGLLVYNLSGYVKTENTLVENARKRVVENTQLSAARMDTYFTQLMQIANQQVQEVEAKHYSKQEIENRVYSVMEKNPEVFGFLIAYKPYKYDTKTARYAYYCDRKDGAIRKMQIKYDYTRENTPGLNWYIRPLQEGPGWTEPYFGVASQSMLSVYSVPFHAVDPVTHKREIVGVVSIVYSLEDIEKYIKDLDMGWGGYAYLISQKGVYMSHPKRDNVLEQMMKFDNNSNNHVFKQRKSSSNSDGIDQELAQKLRSHYGTIYEFKNPTGQEAWVLHQRVPSTGYELGSIFIKDAMVNDKDFARHKFIIVSVLAVLILALLSIFVTKGYPSIEKRLWGISIFISTLLVLGIAMVWFLSTTYNTYSDNDLVIVTDKAAVQREVNKQSSKSAANKPILIPTGVYLQSLEFENANNIKLTGYVWQTYPKGFPEDSRGIIFPEAISGSLDEDKAYTRETRDGQTIGWHFDATLRQKFDYSKYPLDTKDVWLRLWPKDFNRNVILVPDFSSYTLINPDYKPGIANDIILSGWVIKQSFFCYYTNNSYNTDFGIRDYIRQDKFPELAFMALISRQFMNPFISYLLPFVVMAFMLFGTLALIYIIESKAEKFDFSAAGVLAACTGLFFSVVVTHNGLRERITVNGILYLEYFYFVLYAAVILVIVDAFLVAFNSKSQLVQYKDNIIPKILYWPSMLAVILAITVCLFYK